MPEPKRQRWSGRGGRNRSILAALGVVTVDPDFEDEYPDGDAASTEAYATVLRTGEALTAEIDRRVELNFAFPNQSTMTALAVLDGAGQALTPSEIAERLLVASATMTATLDLLEQRGWIRRTPNPADRRSVLVEITPEGSAVADEFLPGIHNLERAMFAVLTPDERVQLLTMLGKVLGRAADIADETPEPFTGRRIRPDRLTKAR